MSERASAPFAGRVAVVTGAGSGIGRATALALARAGAAVVAGDVREDYLAALLAELPGSGHEAVVGDVADEATAQALAAAARTRHGRLDLLVGNVGLMFFKDITDVTVEELDRIMAVNVRGNVLVCKHAIPLLLKSDAGAIVIVSSGSAFVGQEFDGVSSFAYNMSKAAVRQLAVSLATRYAAEGLRVNAIAPGVTRTRQLSHFVDGMTQEQEEEIFRAAADAVAPIGRYAEPDEIARAICFLLSADASYVTGTTLVADGGLLAR